METDTLADQGVPPSLTPAPQEPFVLRRGRSTVLERLKVRAFELYVEGTGTVGEIARRLSCSKQYLYRVAKAEDWATRKARLQAGANGGEGDQGDRAMELARAELAAKVPTRLLELEQRCEKGDLRAIVAWLKLAGVDKPDRPSKPPVGPVDVLNDVSDSQQVPGALAPGGVASPPEPDDPNGGPHEPAE